MCIYVCVWGCLDKYISVATWPLQTKIPDYAPAAPRPQPSDPRSMTTITGPQPSAAHNCRAHSSAEHTHQRTTKREERRKK